MKIHYTKELIDKCTPIFKQGFKYIFSHSKKKTPLNKHLLKTFQEHVEKIPNWNSMIILKEFDRFKINSNCQWLDKLIRAAFVAEFKVASNNNDEMKLDIPKSQDFIHFCYVEIARQLWKKPQIMFDGFSNDIRKLYESELDKIIHTSILKVIKDMLPLEKLINNYLKSVDDDEQYNSDDDEKRSVDLSQSYDDDNDDDNDSSDYDDSDDDSTEPRIVSHTFNEDVEKVRPEDVMINKIGGGDSDDNDNATETETTDDPTERQVLTEEDNILLDDETKKLIQTDDIDINRVSVTEVNDDVTVEDTVVKDIVIGDAVKSAVEDEVVEDVVVTERVIDDVDDEYTVNKSVDNEDSGINGGGVEVIDVSKNNEVEVEQVKKQIHQIVPVTDHTVNEVDIDIDRIEHATAIDPNPNPNPNPNVDANSDTDVSRIETKVVDIQTIEKKKKLNNDKIKNILGIDMNYNDFIKKKDSLRKSLLAKTTA